MNYMSNNRNEQLHAIVRDLGLVDDAINGFIEGTKEQNWLMRLLIRKTVKKAVAEMRSRSHELEDALASAIGASLDDTSIAAFAADGDPQLSRVEMRLYLANITNVTATWMNSVTEKFTQEGKV